MNQQHNPMSRRIALTRRDFTGLAVAGGCTVAGLTASRLEAASVIEQQSLLPIIDTHQHLWDLTKFKLPWHAGLKDSVLPKNYLPSDYVIATKDCNVVRAVYMEVDVEPAQQNAEADYVLQLCKQADSLTKAAVISGRPAEASFAKYVERFAGEPLIRGFRQVLHGSETPPGYCLQPQFVDSMKLLGKMNKSYDLCMRPGDLLDAVKLVDQCPQTKFILDHCGNGPIRSTDTKLVKTWEKGITELSQRKHVICKISGIVASAPSDWKPQDLAPVINHCLEAFGEDRVMFAGDWPVCLLRAQFKQWGDALKSIVSSRSTEFQRKLFHDNAQAFYW